MHLFSVRFPDGEKTWKAQPPSGEMRSKPANSLDSFMCRVCSLAHIAFAQGRAKLRTGRRIGREQRGIDGAETPCGNRLTIGLPASRHLSMTSHGH